MSIVLSLSPFLVFDGTKPLARAEIGEMEPLAPAAAGEEP